MGQTWLGGLTTKGKGWGWGTTRDVVGVGVTHA